MFDQNALAQLEAGYQSSRPQQTTAAPKKTDSRKSWLSAIPSIAAAGASLIPGVGTVGAAALGGLGELGRQAISGEGINAGKIGQEAALSAIPGGLGKIGKVAVKGIRGTKATKEAKTVTKAVEPAPLPKTTTPTVQTGTPTTPVTEVAQPAQGLLSRVKSRMTAEPTEQTATAAAGSRLRGNARNITAGEKIPGTQDVLDQQTADRINQTVSSFNKGMVGRTPRGQLRNVQDGLKTKGAELDELTTRFDNKLDDTALSTLSKSLEEKRSRIVSFDPAKKEHIDLNNNFATRVNNAKSIKELEEVRKDFDKEARRILQNPDSKGTLSANLAKSYRDAIDDYVSTVNPALKAAKGEYRDLRMAEDFLSKSGTLNQKGVNVVVGRTPGGNAIAAAKDAGGKALETIGGDSVGARFGRGLTGQVATRLAIPGSVAGEQAVETSTDPGATVTESTTPTPGMITPETSPGSMADMGSDQIQQGLQAAAIEALARGDTQGIAAIKSVMDIVGAGQKAEKPMSAEAAKVVGNANSGLKSLDQLEAIISEGGVPKGTVLPGRAAFGGFLGNATGTSKYDTISRNVTDAISRLRTGAALTEGEVKFYNSQVPQAFDDPETIRTKVETLRDFFSSVSSRSGTAGTDTQAAITGA